MPHGSLIASQSATAQMQIKTQEHFAASHPRASSSTSCPPCWTGSRPLARRRVGNPVRGKRPEDPGPWHPTHTDILLFKHSSKLRALWHVTSLSRVIPGPDSNNEVSPLPRSTSLGLNAMNCSSYCGAPRGFPLLPDAALQFHMLKVWLMIIQVLGAVVEAVHITRAAPKNAKGTW